MSDSEIETKRVRGFAGIIDSTLTPLKSNFKFQTKFEKKSLKFLLNAKNVNFAALIIIDHGHIKVESIKNKPPENLQKKKVGWDGYLETDTQTFLKISMNRISLLGVAKNWLLGKVKMKGILKLLNLLKMFNFLTKID